MPSTIASESVKGGRHADMSAVHHKEATTKFPHGYDDNAKYHHTTLKAQNKNKAFKPGTLDHYLLLTFFPDIRKADAASKASKSPSKNADKASAAGKADASKADASKADASKADASKAAETPSKLASSSDEEDTSVRQVQELEERAAKDDAPAPAPEATISDILTDLDKLPTVDMDADTLLGMDNPEEDTPENNTEIAEAANAAIRRTEWLLQCLTPPRPEKQAQVARCGRVQVDGSAGRRTKATAAAAANMNHARLRRNLVRGRASPSR